MDSLLPNSLTETVPPEERLAALKHVESEFEQASQLLKKKAYKDALRKYKWVFSQPCSAELHISERDIKNLVRHYRPAHTVVKRWCKDKERLILAGKVDLPLICQWQTLYACLGEKKRAHALHAKLEASGAKKESLHFILSDIWQDFAKARKYDVLKDYLPSLGFYLILHATEYDGLILFPNCRSQSKQHQKEDRQMHVDYMLTEGLLSYETALGLGNEFVASELAKKILSVENSDRFYAGLIRSSIRARAFEVAITLYNDAKKSFSRRRLRKSSAEINRLPKKYRAMLEPTHNPT